MSNGPYISQDFGNVNTWEAQPHAGIDIAGPMGTPMFAPCDMFIVWAGGQPFGYGNTWEMIPGSPASGNCIIGQPPAPHTAAQTSFSHMESIAVSVGQWVTEGTYLGTMGSTGNSSGPHVHWELFIDYAEGIYPAGTFYGRVDPLDYFTTATVVPIGTGGKGDSSLGAPVAVELIPGVSGLYV
ncbi:M23 family metallopeptidase [Arthrobacter sp. MDT1-65]